MLPLGVVGASRKVLSTHVQIVHMQSHMRYGHFQSCDLLKLSRSLPLLGSPNPPAAYRSEYLHATAEPMQWNIQVITVQGFLLLRPWPSCPLPAPRAPCPRVQEAPRGRRPARVSHPGWGVCPGWAPSTTCSLECISRSWGQPLGSTAPQWHQGTPKTPCAPLAGVFKPLVWFPDLLLVCHAEVLSEEDSDSKNRSHCMPFSPAQLPHFSHHHRLIGRLQARPIASVILVVRMLSSWRFNPGLAQNKRKRGNNSRSCIAHDMFRAGWVP